MGLALEVGILADLLEADPEGAEFFLTAFSAVNELLAARGLRPHEEPHDCPVWSADMHGYSGIHRLRRIAAYVDAGKPIPTPGGIDAAKDPVLEAYYGQDPAARGFLSLLRRGQRFAHRFDHLIHHSDAEGLYLPVDFGQVIHTDSRSIPGGMIGSVPRLKAELTHLAGVLSIPTGLRANARALEDVVVDPQPDAEEVWCRYGVETYCCLTLAEGCEQSLRTGAAIVFC